MKSFVTTISNTFLILLLCVSCTLSDTSNDVVDEVIKEVDFDQDDNETNVTPLGETSLPKIGKCNIFPKDNPWNLDVSSFPIHPKSDDYIDSIGRGCTLHAEFGAVWEGAPNGVPFDLVKGDQHKVPIIFENVNESDPGPYPIPPDAQIEGGPNGTLDRHVIVIDTDNCMLYELFNARAENNGKSWNAGSGAVFDLNSNALRPNGWTSADAAGLPIFPGLVRYEEVFDIGSINHALRFTVANTLNGYIHPATHSTNTGDPSGVPMGLRLRMKSSYDCSNFPYEVRVICAALKKYGMIVADNGSNWFITGAPDPRWNDSNLGTLKDIPGDAFEAVYTGEIISPRDD